MKTKANEKIKLGTKQAISKAEFKEKIEAKLITRGIIDPKKATDDQLYAAVSYVLKDIMLSYREDFKRRAKVQGNKKIYYLCMEFLVGRALRCDSKNLGLYDDLCEILEEYGSSFEKVYACEVDPGLGNGGLGRLAACFMDSLTSLDYFAGGFSLLYENGLFKQRLVDGEQVELPDDWLPKGGVRLVPRTDKTVSVKLGGKIEEEWDSGELRIKNYDYEEVNAVPYDLLIPGTDTNAVNTIRLWRARKPYTESHRSTQGSYIKSISEEDSAEQITKQLYPPDNYDSGKLLRLTQQYFLVSASLQSIFNDYLAEHGSLSGFENNVAIHINDTHPALCIPELMRILMDVYSYSWDDAWEIVVKTVSYTNHTVLPEALECWRVDLFSVRLPRIFMIVNEINRRFTADLWNSYPGDWDRISRMSIVAYNQVRMANLSIVGSHSVNGVSKLHSDILKRTVFHDFYKDTPWKFTNVTNGVAHRRWLLNSNPSLTAFLDEKIGVDYRKNMPYLSSLLDFKDDKETLDRIGEIKQENKQNFAKYAFDKCGAVIDPNSFFDVQIKRLHEYKRQLLNLLKIMALYNDLCDNPNMDIQPQTFIFGCKAAPGYVMAKKIIKLIWYLAKELESNPVSRDKLKILFMEEYNVSVAENLIPAANLSEQISLAGKEASGTGCMKLMMNGAVTIGTMDGANVEIAAACGKDNIYVFGLDSKEVEDLWRHGYNSASFMHTSSRLRRVIDRFYSPICGEDFSHIADYLVNAGYGVSDPFMCLADFESYLARYEGAIKDYGNKTLWAKKSLINTATSGIFSSDVSIKKYADEIWHATPIKDLK